MKLGNLKNEATNFLNQYKSKDPAAYAAAQQAVGGLLILDGFIGIDNPLGGKKRPGIFGAVIGVVVGIVLVFIPSIFGSLTGVNKMTATTSGTVVSTSQQQSTSTNTQGQQTTSTSCSAVATYTVNGKQYTQPSSFGSSSMCALFKGETIRVHYNPNNPGQWASDVKTVATIFSIFLWVGVAIFIISAFTAVIRLLSIIFGWKLLKSGRALAKTLPPGTDLTTAIKEIENSFKTSLFGFSAGQSAMQPATTPVYPSQAVPPNNQEMTNQTYTQQTSPDQSMPQQQFSPQQEMPTPQPTQPQSNEPVQPGMEDQNPPANEQH